MLSRPLLKYVVKNRGRAKVALTIPTANGSALTKMQSAGTNLRDAAISRSVGSAEW